MASVETERLLNEIGHLLAEETGHPLASTLLYARLDVNMVALNILIERSDHIQYFRSCNSFTDPLLDLWEEEEPAQRWAEMEYVLRNGKFTVSFTYAGEFDPEEDFFERRSRLVRRHFGDKPIVYPPWPDDAAQQFDL